MVLIKRETFVNLNLKEGEDLGEFNYNESALENLKQSRGLRNLVFQIFRKVSSGKQVRTENMREAVETYGKVLYLKQSDLEDPEGFLAKDYRKALRKFMVLR